jgi:hypothetical protein
VLPGDVLQGELLLPGEQVIGLLKEGCAGTLLAFTLRESCVKRGRRGGEGEEGSWEDGRHKNTLNDPV